MIAVTGANGQLGKLVIKHLVTLMDPSEVIALVRNADAAAELRELGVTIRSADYDKPETLVSALLDVESLLLISSSAVGVRVPQHTAVIKAAQQQGVKNLVYTSILKASDNPMMLAQEHKVTEQLIKDAPFDSVILRNGWYTENYTQNMPAILEHKVVTGVSINGKIHSATRNDYAEAAAKVLVSADQHQGKTYELAGDLGFTLTEFAQEITKQSGIEVTYQAMSENAYKELLVSLGLPEGFAAALADSDNQTEQGWLQEDSKTLAKLLERPTTSLSQVVKASL